MPSFYYDVYLFQYMKFSSKYLVNRKGNCFLLNLFRYFIFIMDDEMKKSIKLGAEIEEVFG